MELVILKWLNSWGNSLDFIIIFTADYLGWWLLFGLLLFVVLGKDKKREIKMALTSLFAAAISRFVFTEIIRIFYSRPRPFEVLDIYQLIFHKAGGALPSGHAAFFFALAVGVYFYRKKFGILFFIGALAIGLARVSAGIHWPSDILAGAIIGFISAFLIYFLTLAKTRKIPNFHDRKSLTNLNKI